MDGRIFALDQQTLISAGIQLLNAAILATALAFLLYKPVRKFMRGRAEGIQSQLDRAQDDMEAAEKLKAFYEQRLEEIELERAGILEEARKLADDTRGRLTAGTEQELAVTRERAEAEILARRERALEEARQEITEAATAMAGKIAAVSLDGAARDRLFEETMAELEGAA